VQHSGETNGRQEDCDMISEILNCIQERPVKAGFGAFFMFRYMWRKLLYYLGQWR